MFYMVIPGVDDDGAVGLPPWVFLTEIEKSYMEPKGGIFTVRLL